jgi:MFS family permease
MATSSGPETGRRQWAVLAVVSAVQFLIILDLWVVNIALPALQRDFAPATLTDVSWILDVYAIALAALLLPAGRAADNIGRRECFLAGLVVFGVASLGCAVAPDLLALIACRALQAAGAAVLMPTSLGLPWECFRRGSGAPRSGYGLESARWPPAVARCSAGCWSSRAGAGSSSSTCPSSSPLWRQAW